MNDVVIKSAGPAVAPNSLTLGASGTISDPPPTLARVDSGHIVRGTVIGLDDQGHVLVRGDHGVLKLATAHPPPLGSQVTLQIRQTGPSLQVLILRVESGQYSGAPGAAAASLDTVAPAPSSPRPIQDLLQIARQVRAVLQVSPPNRGALPAGLQSLTAGQTLQLRIVGIGVASTASPPPATGAPGGGRAEAPAGASAKLPPTGLVAGAAGTKVASAVEQAGTQAAVAQRAIPPAQAGAPATLPPIAPAVQPVPSGAAAAGSASAPPSAPGAKPGVRAASVTMAGGAPQSAPASSGSPQSGGSPGPAIGPTAGSPAGSVPSQIQGAGPSVAVAASPIGPLHFTGSVTHTDPRGLPILQSPLGTLQLDRPIPLPRGASIAFEVLPSSLPATATTPQAALASQPWPGMHELAGLIAGDPGLRAMAELFMPQIGPRLAAGILVLLTALRGGRVDGWLGPHLPAIRALKNGRLLGRLAEDFPRLSRSVEGAGGEWRLHFIPLLGDAGLEQIRLYQRVRGRERDARDNVSEEPTARANRFVIEAALKRLGVLQLDGLVLPDRNRFDLMLRSDRPLSALARQKIRALFQDSAKAAGLQGEIAFQDGGTGSLLQFGIGGLGQGSDGQSLVQRA